MPYKKNGARFLDFLSSQRGIKNNRDFDLDESCLNEILCDLNIKSMGIFGKNTEICQILLQIGFLDNDLYVILSLLCCLSVSIGTDDLMVDWIDTLL